MAFNRNVHSLASSPKPFALIHHPLHEPFFSAFGVYHLNIGSRTYSVWRKLFLSSRLRNLVGAPVKRRVTHRKFKVMIVFQRKEDQSLWRWFFYVYSRLHVILWDVSSSGLVWVIVNFWWQEINESCNVLGVEPAHLSLPSPRSVPIYKSERGIWLSILSLFRKKIHSARLRLTIQMAYMSIPRIGRAREWDPSASSCARTMSWIHNA